MKTARQTLRRRAAFTMIEIALALGVIGFALVAVIGILPAGLNVQRETHQDTIVGQDGPFFLEMIRNGGPAVLRPGLYQGSTNLIGQVNISGNSSLDFLTNYVDSIVVTITTNNGSGVYYTNSSFAYVHNASITSPNTYFLTNGATILGLLSTPTLNPGASITYVTAAIRSLSGAATEQNGSNAVVAFRYYMDVEIDRFSTVANESLDPDPLKPFDPTIQNLEKGYLGGDLQGFSQNPANLYDVRLKFRWPIKPNGVAGPGRQAFRSMISGNLLAYTNNQPINTFWFFRPSSYSTAFLNQ